MKSLSVLAAVVRTVPGMAVMLCAAACTTTKRHESEVGIPQNWQQPAQGAKMGRLDTTRLAHWWTRFDDPALNQLIAEALQSSPDVRTTLARIDEARARRGVTRSALFPVLDGGVVAQGTRSDNRRTGVVTRESHGADLSMSWEIDLFGKLRQNLNADSAALAQAEENYYGTQVTLAANVADAYVDLRAAEAQIAVYERNIKALGDTVDITRWREEAGEGSSFETQQAASTLEQARATIPTLKQAISQTKNRLALLAGRTPGALDALLAKPRGVPRPPSMLALGIPAETLRQRPDVRATERGIEAAVARTKAAEREQLPSLSLSGVLSTDATKASEFLSPQTVAASVLGGLSSPIFNAGRIRQTINIQNAQEKQAVIAYESTVLTALSEVENALIAVRRTLERLGTLDGAIKLAREAATLAQQSFESGQVDLLDVLDTQRTLLSLEEQQTLTLGDNASAHIQLYKALGGGWAL